MRPGNDRLKDVLIPFSQNYVRKREAALAGVDFEATRERLAGVKDRALAELNQWLVLFEKKVVERGGRVYRTRDGIEANTIIFKILTEAGANYLVKSKSMVSEETGLNAFLEDRGITVRETDLGEWIVQLRREKPTHMVMPAIHLDRKEVARVFSGHLEREVPADIPTLVELARQELRRDIGAAGAGLLGANALIAETGSVMVVTNEGNGRLVSLVPPVRLVLATIEKVLPTLADAFLLLELLPPCATGQKMTSYVSFLAPSLHKPTHVILLDNHRSEILADPIFRPVLRCLKCSACLNVCPVYQTLGGKHFGHVYMGGIGALLTAWIHGLRESRKLADLCLGCHRCETFCPTKIPIADLVLALRERLHRKLGQAIWKRLLFDGAMAEPARWQRILAGLAAASPLIGTRDGFVRSLPGPLSRFDRHRALPLPARPGLSGHRKRARIFPTRPVKRGEILLFTGCLVDSFYPEIGEAATSLLARFGYKSRLVSPGCCGFPAFNAGFRDAAASALRPVLTSVEGADWILTLCPTCTTMLKHHAPHILGPEKARFIAERVLPVSHYVAAADWREFKELIPSTPANWTVTYHDSCHHKHVLGASGSSRLLLEFALGRRIEEMERPDACCGFGGLFSIRHPEISASLLEDKLGAIERTQADVVTLDCPGCLLQIRGGLRRHKSPIVVRHTVEILEARLSRKALV